jgi:hypothetical protein
MMSLLLLHDLAHEKAASNRRIAQSVVSAAQRVEELRRLKEKLTTPRRRITSDTQEALRYTLAEAAEARSIWQGARELFEEGLEGGEARELLQVVLEVFASWFGLAKTTRDLWQVTVEVGATPEGLTELDLAEGHVQALQKSAEDLKAFLTRARPPVDPALLDKARQAVGQGRFKSPEEVRSRLPGHQE